MPLDPKRVQAVFLKAVNCHDPADREVILKAECSADVELRQRVEALLRAHDQFNDFLNQPFVGPRTWPSPSGGPHDSDDRGAGEGSDQIDEGRVSGSGG
jgi:hypothetical protein